MARASRPGARGGGSVRLPPKRLETGIRAVGAASIAYEVVAEHRREIRYSLTPRRAYLRLPHGTPDPQVARARVRFFEWLAAAVARRPDLARAHEIKAFATGDIWRLGERAYRLELVDEPRRRGATARRLRAKLVSPALHPALPPAAGAAAAGREVAAPPPETIRIMLPPAAVPGEPSDPTAAHDPKSLIERLLYRLAVRAAQASVEALVAEINAAHFRVAVTRVRLSATTSRWGSCSASGTIALSARLLAAPPVCLRAVIVHELAHRREMNHSPRFWDLVYRAMPTYPEADAWLRAHGASLGWTRVERPDA